MTRALVFGAGGVGCIYAYFLEKAGAAVTAVCRTNYQAVKDRGILIRSKKWGKITAHPTAVKTVSEAKPHGPFDYILVCSKAFPGTSALIKDAVTPESAIVLAQNGIAVEEEYAEMFPHNTIITGAVYLPTIQVEPGVVEHLTPLEQFDIGTYPSQASSEAKDRVKRFSELFAAAGASAPVYDDVQPQRWSKVALNASLNPICALTLCDDANFIRSSDGALQMAKDVMKEVSRVAVAEGYHNITDGLIDEHMQRHIARLETGGKAPSMLTDVVQGRPIEVEAILGNTVRIADKHGIETPYLRMLYMLAKARNFSMVKGDGWKPIIKVE